MPKTAELAEDIRRQHLLEPDRPIFLIGRSGGSVLVLGVAELLPPNRWSESSFCRPRFRQAAMTCGRHARNPAGNCLIQFRPGLVRARLGHLAIRHRGSPLLQLGREMRLQATAGERPGRGRELYRRLVEIRWTPTMLLHGNNGGHIGTIMPSFLATDVAPWLKP